MREIKFRALGFIAEEEKWEWFYYTPESAYAIYKDDGVIKAWKVRDSQFTGLLDKKGKEIYEGDIVKIGTGYTFEVTLTKFQLGYKGSKCYGYNEYDDAEIIGNIYENKELIK